MKEIYFTTANISIKAQSMLASLDWLNIKRPFNFQPERSALVVLDMQSYFLSPKSHAYIPSAPAILLGINAMINAYNTKNLPIIYTRHINTDKDAGLMASWWHDLIREDDPLNLVDPNVKPSNGIEIIKRHYDAFFDTPLDKLLQDQGVKQLVICGVMTHLCCETTARSAFMHGYEVFFTVDGTATYNEAFHRASLLNLSHGFATPMLIHKILFHLQALEHE